MKLTHLSLFSGIGGIDLAAEWAGFETVCFVEKDEYCQKVLKKHWPDVPIMEDIHDVTKGTIGQAIADADLLRIKPRTSRNVVNDINQPGEHSTGAREAADLVGLRGLDFPITLVTGGFPCQPVSVAGQRRGKEDDRWLWPEMLRIITEVRPGWVVAENVAGLIHMGLDDCISDLENIGYTVEPYLIPACAAGAPHRRDRIFIVGHSEQPSEDEQSTRGRPRDTVGESGSTLVNAPGDRCDGGAALGRGRHSTTSEVGADTAGQCEGDGRQCRSRQGSSDVANPPQPNDGGGNARAGRGREPEPGDGRGESDVADATGLGRGEGRSEPERQQGRLDSTVSSGNATDSEGAGLEGPDTARDSCPGGCATQPRQGGRDGDWWAVEPDVGRVAHGVPSRVDRLRALGNAVVPQQVYPILKAIADIERQR